MQLFSLWIWGWKSQKHVTVSAKDLGTVSILVEMNARGKSGKKNPKPGRIPFFHQRNSVLQHVTGRTQDGHWSLRRFPNSCPVLHVLNLPPHPHKYYTEDKASNMGIFWEVPSCDSYHSNALRIYWRKRYLLL